MVRTKTFQVVIQTFEDSLSISSTINKELDNFNADFVSMSELQFHNIDIPPGYSIFIVAYKTRD